MTSRWTTLLLPLGVLTVVPRLQLSPVACSSTAWPCSRSSACAASAAELRAVGADMDTSVAGLPAHVAAHVYRIGAEVLTNAGRHGAAQKVAVVLARTGSTASAEVCDDGRGLCSMRARADTIGACLSIGPGAGGHGTRVALSLPAVPDEGAEERSHHQDPHRRRPSRDAHRPDPGERAVRRRAAGRARRALEDTALAEMAATLAVEPVEVVIKRLKVEIPAPARS